MKRKVIFKLNYETIKKLLDCDILSKVKNIQYDIYKAKYTNSFYIKFMLGPCYITTRISDHKAFNDAKGIVISKYTTESQVVRLFLKRIQDLRYKSIMFLFKKIKYQKGENHV